MFVIILLKLNRHILITIFAEIMIKSINVPLNVAKYDKIEKFVVNKLIFKKMLKVTSNVN